MNTMSKNNINITKFDFTEISLKEEQRLYKEFLERENLVKVETDSGIKYEIKELVQVVELEKNSISDGKEEIDKHESENNINEDIFDNDILLDQYLDEDMKRRKVIKTEKPILSAKHKLILSDKNVKIYRYTFPLYKYGFLSDLFEKNNITDYEEIRVLRNEFKSKWNEYFSTIKAQVKNNNAYSVLKDNATDFLNHHKANMKDKNKILYYIWRYYPKDITKYLNSTEIDEGMWHLKNNKKRITENVQNIDKQLKKVLKEQYTDSIINMYHNNKSFKYIQKVLTADAISKNLIPVIVKRYSRKRGEEKNLQEMPALFHMSCIKLIIKENDISFKNVGRYKG